MSIIFYNMAKINKWLDVEKACMIWNITMQKIKNNNVFCYEILVNYFSSRSNNKRFPSNLCVLFYLL